MSCSNRAAPVHPLFRFAARDNLADGTPRHIWYGGCHSADVHPNSNAHFGDEVICGNGGGVVAVHVAALQQVRHSVVGHVYGGVRQGLYQVLRVPRQPGQGRKRTLSGGDSESSVVSHTA